MSTGSTDSPMHDGETRDEQILDAVAAFIELVDADERPQENWQQFLARFPDDLRTEIEVRCREYLGFDAAVGPIAERRPPAAGARQLGDFVIREELGRGGMGIVYLADQMPLARRVALKVLSPGYAFSARHVERFRQEASAAAKLQHPGIVPIYAYGEVEGTLYYAMEHVAGQDLAQLLDGLRPRDGERDARRRRHRRLGVLPGASYRAEIAELVAQVAEALQHAHEQSIIHRDMKPSNVMLGADGRARILDFGLAKNLADDSGDLSRSGELTGTPHYMSPEQLLARRAPIDHRSDIFSLGVMLYELLALQRPFEGRDLHQLVLAISFHDPPALQQLEPNLPRDLVTVCMKALEKDPRARYDTAADFAADLRRILSWRPILARPAGPVTRTMKWVRRHRLGMACGVALLVATIGGLVWSGVEQARIRRDALQLIDDAETRLAAGELDQASELARQAKAEAPDEPGIALRAKVVETARDRELVANELTIAKANRLVVQAESVLDADPELGMALALEAHRLLPGPIADRALFRALSRRIVSRRLNPGGKRKSIGASLDPLGRFALTHYSSSAVQLWPTDSSAPPRNVHSDSPWVIGAGFTTDGRRLVIIEHPHTVRVWSLPDLAPIRSHTVQAAAATQQFVTVPGKIERIATLARDRRVRVIDLQAGAGRAVDLGDGPGAYAMTVDPYGTWLAVTMADHSLQVVELETLQVVQSWREGEGRTYQGAKAPFSPDGTLLARVRNAGDLVLHRTADWSVHLQFEVATLIRTIEFSPNGELVAVCCEDGTVRLWRTTDGSEHGVASVRDGRAAALEFSGDSQRFAVGSDTGDLLVVDVPTMHAVARMRESAPIWTLGLDDTGRRLLVSPRLERARLWDLEAGRAIVRLTGQVGSPNTAAFSPDGDLLIASTSSASVVVYDPVDATPLCSFLGRGLPICDARAIDEQRLLVCTRGDVALYDCDSGSVEVLKTLPRDVAAAQVLADGRRAILFRYGSIERFDRESGRSKSIVTVRDPIRRGAATGDGATLAFVGAGPGARIHLWSESTGTERQIEGHTGSVEALSFSRDGVRLAVGTDAGEAIISNARTGEVLAAIGAGSGVSSMAFSFDGNLLALGCENGLVRVLDWRSEEVLCVYPLHDHPIDVVSFDPSGTRVVSGGREGIFHAWPIDPLSVCAEHPPRELTLLEREAFGLQTEEHHAIRRLVDDLHEQLVLTTRVRKQLAIDLKDEPETLRLALDYAEETANTFLSLVLKDAREVLLSPDLDPAAYLRAARRAKVVSERSDAPSHMVWPAALGLCRTGRPAEALAILDRLRDRRGDAEDDAARAVRALACHATGDVEGARRALGAIGELDPAVLKIVPEFPVFLHEVRTTIEPR